MYKVGIVTFTTGDNFGQRLQNYALQNVLSRMDCEVYTIRKMDFRLKRRYWFKKHIKALVVKKEKALLRRHRYFEEFDNCYIEYHNKIINSEHVPTNLASIYDFFVAGSDQVWNPYSGDVNDFNFLTFAEPQQKFSYAASLSVDSLPCKYVEKYRERLKDFELISVREKSGEKIIRQLLGKKPNIVLDPTFLLEREVWEKLERRPTWLNAEKFILKYFLGEEENQEIYDLANELKLPIIDILDEYNETFICGPQEFVYLIHHSDYVVTDSFHGTVFSIIFEKQFIQIKREDELVCMESRFDTIYKILEIERTDVSFMAIKNGNILDYKKINNNLEVAKSESEGYLRNIMSVYNRKSKSF